MHSDHLGGTNILSDYYGNEAGAVRYHSYGRTRVETGLVPTDKRYTGQTLDASTGLYFYGARYYDCWLSQFVQPDSIVPQPGNPQSLNRYAYTLNNPLKYTDPTGHAEDIVHPFRGKGWVDAGGGGAGGIGIVLLLYYGLRVAVQAAGQGLSEISSLWSNPSEATGYGKGARRDPVQEAHDEMVAGLLSPKFLPGQIYTPPGGWNLDPKDKAKWLAIFAAVLAASIRLAEEKGLSLPQQAANPFGRGWNIRISASEDQGPSWRAGGEWGGWTDQFYEVHGQLPTIQDVYDRQWSLDFLTRIGHGPTDEDWKRHSDDASYMGQ